MDTPAILCGSALLPHPSTLKLTSLLLASEASLRLAFYARRRLALRAQPPLPSLVAETHYQILCVSLLASEVEDYSLCGYCYCLTKQGTVGEYIVEIWMWTKCICAFIITHTHTHTNFIRDETVLYIFIPAFRF